MCHQRTIALSKQSITRKTGGWGPKAPPLSYPHHPRSDGRAKTKRIAQMGRKKGKRRGSGPTTTKIKGQGPHTRPALVEDTPAVFRVTTCGPCFHWYSGPQHDLLLQSAGVTCEPKTQRAKIDDFRWRTHSRGFGPAFHRRTNTNSTATGFFP